MNNLLHFAVRTFKYSRNNFNIVFEVFTLFIRLLLKRYQRSFKLLILIKFSGTSENDNKTNAIIKDGSGYNKPPFK